MNQLTGSTPSQSPNKDKADSKRFRGCFSIVTVSIGLCADVIGIITFLVSLPSLLNKCSHDFIPDWMYKFCLHRPSPCLCYGWDNHFAGTPH
jgi:hypothetical protein